MGIVKNVTGFVVKHKRTILTVVSIGSMAYGVYRAYKDGPEFKRLIDKLEEEEASLGTKIKTLAPVVAPTAAAVIVSSVSTVANQVCATKEIKELSGDLAQVTSVLAITQSSKELIEKKAREMLGDEAFENVEKEVFKEKAKACFDNSTSNSSSSVIVQKQPNFLETGHGNQLFLDAWTNTFFYSDISFVKNAINELNFQLMNDMSISVSEYLLALDLPSDLGRTYSADDYNPNEYWGWDMNGTRADLIRVDYEPGIDEMDRTFTVIKFRNEPTNKKVWNW